MKKTLLTLMSLLFILSVEAQNSDTTRIDNANGDKIFVSVEHEPEFPGGKDQFYRYLVRTIKYPMAAYKNNTQGRVIIQMVVEKDGSLTNITVARGIGDGCDEEAVRVMKRCPKWKPAMQNGRAVRVEYTVPISFTLVKQ